MHQEYGGADEDDAPRLRRPPLVAWPGMSWARKGPPLWTHKGRPDQYNRLAWEPSAAPHICWIGTCRQSNGPKSFWPVSGLRWSRPCSGTALPFSLVLHGPCSDSPACWVFSVGGTHRTSVSTPGPRPPAGAFWRSHPPTAGSALCPGRSHFLHHQGLQFRLGQLLLYCFQQNPAASRHSQDSHLASTQVGTAAGHPWVVQQASAEWAASGSSAIFLNRPGTKEHRHRSWSASPRCWPSVGIVSNHGPLLLPAPWPSVVRAVLGTANIISFLHSSTRCWVIVFFTPPSHRLIQSIPFGLPPISVGRTVGWGPMSAGCNLWVPSTTPPLGCTWFWSYWCGCPWTPADWLGLLPASPAQQWSP